MQKVIRNKLKPLNPILLVSDEGIKTLGPDDISIDLVGEKAFGLSCLPSLWTLPFFVISHKLVDSYNKNKEINSIWVENIIIAAQSALISHDDDIIVRSSGCIEGMKERGKYYSQSGNFNNIIFTIKECIDKLINDIDFNSQNFPLIIQRYISVYSAAGHLSNERRLNRENRDWVCEYELHTLAPKQVKDFKINLRYWREEINYNIYLDKSLSCNLEIQLSNILKIPAAWVYRSGLRIHFEWIWDGEQVYLVQADEEKITDGVSPVKKQQSRCKNSNNFVPKCLKEVTSLSSTKYHKIQNVFCYYELGLPIAKLYILDNQDEIQNIASGKISLSLQKDIQELVKNPLIIRSDINSEDKTKRQMLPRTEEIYTYEDAINWLKTNCVKLLQNNNDNIAFIFHNFIPSISSAFAYAEPDHNFVLIESLWGVPEGLYYNSHDLYIVDTKTNNVDNLQIEKFDVVTKNYCKYYFVSPDPDGHWTTKVTLPPYDWHNSIRKEEWVKQIALHSRRIAHKENKSLSIMWFVEVPENICLNRVFPWYHEPFDIKNIRNQQFRRKTPFDETFIIETKNDIEELNKVINTPHNIRSIQIHPKEESILRNKDTLKEIGEISKKINANIFLEGSLLSHPYYQLIGTGAIVEVKFPIVPNDNVQEFNKLVRDFIPENIKNKGEDVSYKRLKGEYLLKALREKLLEEAYEVLDANERDSILEELADVNEVIDGILFHIGIGRDELEKVQKKKLKKAGGFAEGFILTKTQNPVKKEKSVDNIEINISGLEQPETINIPVEQEIEKWSDKREHLSSTEYYNRYLIPAYRDSWNLSLNSKNLNTTIKISGLRKGSKIQLELSVYKTYEQISFFD